MAAGLRIEEDATAELQQTMSPLARTLLMKLAQRQQEKMMENSPLMSAELIV